MVCSDHTAGVDDGAWPQPASASPSAAPAARVFAMPPAEAVPLRRDVVGPPAPVRHQQRTGGRADAARLRFTSREVTIVVARFPQRRRRRRRWQATLARQYGCSGMYATAVSAGAGGLARPAMRSKRRLYQAGRGRPLDAAPA